MRYSAPRFHHEQGFTLIEVSIVLVVIGLIVGGVLLGKDMIRASEMRSQISQVQKIQTAVTTFKTKYNCIPGDCSTATAFFTGVTNGDGNGVVCRRASVSIYSCDVEGPNTTIQWSLSGWMELSSVFDHLAASGLVDLAQYDETVDATALPGVGFPIMQFQGTGNSLAATYGLPNLGRIGGMMINYMKSSSFIREGHKLMLGACSSSYFFCGMAAQEGFQFDSKMDDGAPLSGKVTIGSFRYMYRVPGNPSNETDCTGSNFASVNQYNISASNPNRSCVPMVDLHM